QPTRLVSVMLGGVALLRLPIWGFLSPRDSYRIEAGSLWVASDLIANTLSLQGCFTGLRIKGGTLQLSAPASVSGDQIVISAAMQVVLDVELDPQSPKNLSKDAGSDAAAMTLQMPRTLRLAWNGGSAASIVVSRASCTVFGCSVDFQ